MDNNSHPETVVIINCVLNAPLMLISIIGNTLVLAAILRTPSLRSPSFILLCSLTVSDVLVGFVVQPLYITYELTKKRFPVQSYDHYGFCCLWCFALYNNIHNCGSVLGSSLSHAISEFDDNKTRYGYIGDSLAHELPFIVLLKH